MITFRRAASVVFALVLMVVVDGCADDGTITTSSPANPAALATGGASTLFAITASGTQVQSFSLKGTGAAATTLTLPTAFQATAVAVDGGSSTLYVAGIQGAANSNLVHSVILAYPVSATGAATATRTITDNGSIPSPAALAVDSKGQLYVNAAGTVAVYSATATGTAVPVQLITGTSTQLAPTGQSITGLGIAVDTAGNIYDTVRSSTAANVQTVNMFVFANGATGNVAPVRVMTAPAADTQAYGPVVDANQNAYLVEVTSSSTAPAASIAEYSGGVSGVATPFASISGGPIVFLGGLQRDSVGNLYTINVTSSGYAVLGYGPASTGTVATLGLNLALSGVTSMSYQVAVQ